MRPQEKFAPDDIFTNVTIPSEEVPDFPSAVAVITTGASTELAVTSPVADTLALSGLLDDHVMARPVRTFPFASRSVAVSCFV
ncbi:MAG TPA: hypothetical protein VHM24_11065 [Gemmatimonadaceae bacterium]|nr:hypothetical protein [Gemmatimonadaceae bacterium]